MKLKLKLILIVALTLSQRSDVRKVEPDWKWLERPVDVWNHPAGSLYRPEMEVFDLPEPILFVTIILSLALTLSLRSDVRKVVPHRKWWQHRVDVWSYLPSDF